ncbi:MAG: hypothetical protein EAZ95_13810, partial [Bacteroidetes bacterium]
NKIFRKEDTLNPNIEKALTCLQNADYAGYFDEMDKVEMPPYLAPVYAEHKGKFMLGLRTFDFSQQLTVFAKEVNRDVA